ncbi:MAG: S26 family signal peptidase [Candidatus Limnocylindrus sp.]|jgi:signal peptidase I
MLPLNGATGEPFVTPDRLSLRTRLGAEISIEGLTVGAPATVEIAVRPKGQRSRRLRIRRVGDGSITFGATQHLVGESPATSMEAQPSLLAKFGNHLANLLFVAVLALGVATLTGTVTLQVVTSGSMAPTLNVGDLVVAVSDEIVPPKGGDIVIFSGTKLNGAAIGPFAHRIVGGSAATGWQTRGDANPSNDPFVSGPTEVRGTVIAWAPGIGRIFDPRVLLVLLGGLVVLLLLR